MSAPVLVPIDYTKPIYLRTDVSGEGWGAVLEQVHAGSERQPSRFESGIWRDAQINYPAFKQELLALRLALEKLHPFLIGVHFSIETDAKSLVYLLQRPSSHKNHDIVIRWVNYISLFDFLVSHISGVDNPVADALSRLPQMDTQPRLCALEVLPTAMRVTEPDLLADPGAADLDSTLDVGTIDQNDSFIHYKGYMMAEILAYLRDGITPSDLGVEAVQKFIDECTKFTIDDRGTLHYVKPLPNDELKILLVPITTSQVDRILQLHDAMGHKGLKSILDLIKLRFWWPSMVKEVTDYIAGCHVCQVY